MTQDAFLVQIKNYAKEANAKYFDGQLNLSVVSFRISTKAFRSLGNFSCRKDRVTGKAINQRLMIASVTCRDEKVWKTTVTHELVHCWQAQTGRELDHGMSFHSMATKIRQINPAMIVSTYARNIGSDVRSAIDTKRLKRNASRGHSVTPQGRAAFEDMLNQLLSEKSNGNAFAAAAKTPGAKKPFTNTLVNGTVATKEFLVSKGNRNNFITNLTYADINQLKAAGYTVSKNLGISVGARVRKCKNVTSLMEANYSYSMVSVNKVMPSRMEM
jgi:hypothetical protein